MLVNPASLLNPEIKILDGAILNCDPPEFTIEKKSASPEVVVVESSFKSIVKVTAPVPAFTSTPVPPIAEVTPVLAVSYTHLTLPTTRGGELSGVAR